MRTLITLVSLILLMQFLPYSPILADGERLAVGDLINIEVEDEKDLTKSYQLDKEGCVTLPGVEKIKIVGLSTSEASETVNKALSQIMVDPHTTIRFLERAKIEIFVVGSVKSPGLVTVGSGDRVIQALAQAGYNNTADLAHVNVRRGNEVINLDLTKYLKGEDLNVNIELKSGDTVVVPQMDAFGNVQVIGKVNSSGLIPLKLNMTFREAIGVVGGVTVEADTAKITVRREGLAEPLPVDYDRAMQGDHTADVRLQSGDVIYIPEIDNSFFTVMGAVNSPGRYPLKGKVKISEAIGIAGGVIPKLSDLRNVTINRKSSSDKPAETIKVNLNDILHKAAEEPIVQYGDVIYVKEAKQKPTVLQLLQSIMPFTWILR